MALQFVKGDDVQQPVEQPGIANVYLRALHLSLLEIGPPRLSVESRRVRPSPATAPEPAADRRAARDRRWTPDRRSGVGPARRSARSLANVVLPIWRAPTKATTGLLASSCRNAARCLPRAIMTSPGHHENWMADVQFSALCGGAKTSPRPRETAASGHPDRRAVRLRPRRGADAHRRRLRSSSRVLCCAVAAASCACTLP